MRALHTLGKAAQLHTCLFFPASQSVQDCVPPSRMCLKRARKPHHHNCCLPPPAPPAEAEALIQAGEAIAWLDDSSVYMGGLAPVKALTPLLPSPYAFAVKLGNDDLADK